MLRVEIAGRWKEISDKCGVVGLKGVSQLALRWPEEIEIARNAVVARRALQYTVERPERQWNHRPRHEDQPRQRRLRRSTDEDNGQRNSQEDRRHEIDEPRADRAFRPPTPGIVGGPDHECGAA